MNKYAHELATRIVSKHFSKRAANRSSELMLGPLSAGLNDNPQDTYGKSLVRSLSTGAGALGGGMLGGGLAHGMGAKDPALLLSIIAGLVGGGIGGRALGENMTNYDPKRGY